MNDIKVPDNTNPQKGIDSKFGTYADPASKLSDGDKFPNMKEGAQPSPFKSVREG